MKRLVEDSERARRFAERELRRNFADPLLGLVVENERGATIGAIILNDYTIGRNIEVTGVGRNAWDIRIIRGILRYCFARARRITCRTSVRNAAAIKALRAMGFREEGLMREFFDDGDAIVYGLLRNEQKLVRIQP